MTAKILRLTVEADTVRKPKRKAAKPTFQRPLTRDQLLAMLRRESKARTGTRYSIKEDTPLVELAYLASVARGRSIIWRGIRFPIRHSLWKVVLDPETYEPLISAPGGVLF